MSRAASTTAASDLGALLRRRQLARIHAMAKELALAEDCYRSMVSLVSGARTESAGDLTERERDALIDRLRELGAGRKRTPTPRDDVLVRKIRVLWLALWHLGEIEDASEAALRGFAARQTRTKTATGEGLASLTWLDGDGARAVIEALRARLGRAGFQAPQTDGATSARAAKEALAGAIWDRLAAVGAARVGSREALNAWASYRALNRKDSLQALSPQQLDDAIAALGRWLRAEMDKRLIDPPLSQYLARQAEAGR
jgi:hypothetical protein